MENKVQIEKLSKKFKRNNVLNDVNGIFENGVYGFWGQMELEKQH